MEGVAWSTVSLSSLLFGLDNDVFSLSLRLSILFTMTDSFSGLKSLSIDPNGIARAELPRLRDADAFGKPDG